MSDDRLFKVIRTDGQKYFDIEYVRDVVTCADCKNANTEDCSLSYWDDDWGEWRVGYNGDDWFCADGEREGEPQTCDTCKCGERINQEEQK